jgi:hypothetical protein
MGAPHNKKRYGETWDEIHTAVMVLELTNLQGVLGGSIENVIISGGWAWCLMTPDHTEYKHAHDLKDIDLFVKPEFMGEFVEWLGLLGYSREHTKYDHLSPFYRYSKMLRGRGCAERSVTHIEKKIILDVFVKDVPSVESKGFRVVEPSTLASFYGMHNPDSLLHGSGQCWSLALARGIMNNGESPVNHREMANFDKFLSQKS